MKEALIGLEIAKDSVAPLQNSVSGQVSCIVKSLICRHLERGGCLAMMEQGIRDSKVNYLLLL